MRETAATRAAHQTIKRIILSHMQLVMLCMGLNVPWPKLVMQLMLAFNSMSSISQHVAQVGCFVDTDNPVRKQSRFLYASSLAVALFPLCFVALLWIYWMLLVPLPYCRRLSCGKRHHITMSDPVPNALRRCCGYHVNQGVMQTARPPSLNRRETVFSVVSSSSRRVSREDLEEEDTT